MLAQCHTFLYINIHIFTLMKIMLGKTKVRVVSVNDPNKSTKSDMKGRAAVTRVLPAKRRARRRKRRLRFSLEYKLLSGLRNLVYSIDACSKQQLS
ncbi:unnamed protein product, partial [Vitis vinifera]